MHSVLTNLNACRKPPVRKRSSRCLSAHGGAIPKNRPDLFVVTPFIMRFWPTPAPALRPTVRNPTI
jgi:hypothetical protein